MLKNSNTLREDAVIKIDNAVCRWETYENGMSQDEMSDVSIAYNASIPTPLRREGDAAAGHSAEGNNSPTEKEELISPSTTLLRRRSGMKDFPSQGDPTPSSYSLAHSPGTRENPNDDAWTRWLPYADKNPNVPVVHPYTHDPSRKRHLTPDCMPLGRTCPARRRPKVPEFPWDSSTSASKTPDNTDNPKFTLVVTEVPPCPVRPVGRTLESSLLQSAFRRRRRIDLSMPVKKESAKLPKPSVPVTSKIRPLSPMKTKPQVSYPFDAPTISSSPKNGTLASFEAFDASTSPMKSKPQVSLPFEAPTTSSSPKKCVTPVSLPLNAPVVKASPDFIGGLSVPMKRRKLIPNDLLSPSSVKKRALNPISEKSELQSSHSVSSRSPRKISSIGSVDSVKENRAATRQAGKKEAADDAKKAEMEAAAAKKKAEKEAADAAKKAGMEAAAAKKKKAEKEAAAEKKRLEKEAAAEKKRLEKEAAAKKREAAAKKKKLEKEAAAKKREAAAAKKGKKRSAQTKKTERETRKAKKQTDGKRVAREKLAAKKAEREADAAKRAKRVAAANKGKRKVDVLCKATKASEKKRSQARRPRRQSKEKAKSSGRKR